MGNSSLSEYYMQWLQTLKLSDFSEMNPLQKLFFILVGILLIFFIEQIFEYYIGIYRIKNRIATPKMLIYFPTQQTSREDFLNVYQKIKNFKYSLATNTTANLELDESEINHLHLQGKSADKYQPGRYYYFQIQDGCVIENFLQWPSMPGRFACRISRASISFMENEGKVFTDHKLLEEYGRSMKDETYWQLLETSEFAHMILGNLDTIYHDWRLEKNTSAYEENKNLFLLITDIRVENEKIILFGKNQNN